MAAGGSGSGQPQFLVRAGDENFSHALLIENPKNDQIIVPNLRPIYNLVHSTSGVEQVANKPLLKTVFQVMRRLFNPHKTTLMFVIRDKTREDWLRLEEEVQSDSSKLIAFDVFSPGCKSTDCINRFNENLSFDDIIDWFATTVLYLPRILYYSKDTLVIFRISWC
uniref:Uncharacterized protein n=1 Tax=Cucumis melo TaxID=3656 RepID=A0A9I9E4V1_CUCME